MDLDEIKNKYYDSETLFGMATLKKQRSRLPMNLYLDDSGTYLDSGHGPHIMFQNNKNNRANTRELIPMTISDNPEIPVSNYKSLLDGISENDIKLVKRFVRSNKDKLLRLCDRDDNYDIQDFLKEMII